MAKIELEGFVNEHVGNPVFVLKVAENHRKKDESGNFVNDGKTFFQVKAGYESGIDLAQFPKDSRVRVFGKQRTKSREYNGKTYYDLVVAADRIEVLDNAQQAQGGSTGGFGGGNSSSPGNSGQGGAGEWANPGATFDDTEAPF